ncbi:Crp/Fnr family transcriptional regulator [Maribacter algicola]|uniref:Crp/Fnr family transcriptional regulator n=1 Tax=Meishania litoralis TaxID=3434685 RepID=A0ACC7LQX9_9FLAO
MIGKVLDLHFPELARMPLLKEELISASQVRNFKAGTVILKQGEYIRAIPLLISGLVKVFKEESTSGGEVLLYYIKPGESCAISLATLLRNGQSQVKAVIEEDAEVVVVSGEKVLAMVNNHPKWNEFAYDLFNEKFEELLHVIEVLTFANKDIRLLDYLRKEANLKKSNTLHTTHQHIADELGSSREVISRLLKKLENQGFVILKQGTIVLVE